MFQLFPPFYSPGHTSNGGQLWLNQLGSCSCHCYSWCPLIVCALPTNAAWPLILLNSNDRSVTENENISNVNLWSVHPQPTHEILMRFSMMVYGYNWHPYAPSRYMYRVRAERWTDAYNRGWIAGTLRESQPNVPRRTINISMMILLNLRINYQVSIRYNWPSSNAPLSRNSIMDHCSTMRPHWK